MKLFVLVSTLVPIAEGGNLMMWIPGDIHNTFIGPGILVYAVVLSS